jgi:Na+-transporting NADH:ubiquinone oxidoreductase subunit A
MKIKKGLDIPITGQAETPDLTNIEDKSNQVKTVAVLGRDYHGLRPTMKVQEGDKVLLGQTLFEDKKNPGIQFTAPGAGVVKAINRGAKRVLQSVVIELDEQEASVSFPAHASDTLSSLSIDSIKQILQDSGSWTAFRTRPFSKVPAKDAQPYAIYVTAVDTNPLAADPVAHIEAESAAFLDGLAIISHLTANKVYICHEKGKTLPKSPVNNVEYKGFSGVHPAGLAGTHIHLLTPVGEHRTVWTIHSNDIIAIGKLFTTGKLHVKRMISLAGSVVKRPRLVWSRMGANTNEMIEGELDAGDVRLISGSVLNGHRAVGPVAYLGRYAQQITVIPESQPRQFLHWINPFLKQFSVLNVFFSGVNKNKPIELTSSQNGSPRAMVPLGNYEAVMPLDILPTQLLRALLVRDTEEAKKLGCLELDEEDLALCTFVCHGKYEYGAALRACLEIIEKEG